MSNSLIFGFRHDDSFLRLVQCMHSHSALQQLSFIRASDPEHVAAAQSLHVVWQACLRPDLPEMLKVTAT
jgi:hypothetical protein